MATRLKGLKITEVSSVDRGAGEGVKVVLHKRDFTQGQRDSAASSGAALPDGSFPIENGKDLENAIHAIGRAKNPAKAKAHIRARARALGMTDKLPETWGKRDDGDQQMQDQIDKAFDALHESVASILSDDGLEDKGAALNETFGQAHDYIGKLVANPAASTVAKGEAMSDELKKQLDELTAKLAERDEEIATLKAAKKPDDKDADADADCAKIDKAALPEPVRKALEEAEVIKADLAILKAKDALVENTKIAKAHGLADGMGETVMKAYSGDRESVTKLLEVIKAQTAQLQTSTVFKEFGTATEGKVGSAYEQVMAKAAELRKSDPKLSEAQAFAKVYEGDRELREAVKREKAGAA